MSSPTSPNLALDTLYQDVLLEHAKEPRNFGALVLSTPGTILRKEGFNPLCGDHVIIEVKLEEKLSEAKANSQKIEAIGFTGQGCSICMASASIAMQESEGRSVSEVTKDIERFRGLLQGQIDREEFDSDVKALAGVQRFPVRIKCALLPWMTLRETLQSADRPAVSAVSTEGANDPAPGNALPEAAKK